MEDEQEAPPSGADDADQKPTAKQFRKLATELGLFNLDLDPDPALLDRLVEVVDQLPQAVSQEVTNAMLVANTKSDHLPEAFLEKYNISKAENRLLVSLAEGRSVVQHAQSLGISVNTARTHMRRLLEKTGASGQLDLLRMYFN